MSTRSPAATVTEYPTLIIAPNGVYDDGVLVLGLGLTHATLARDRRGGLLRFTRKGKRTLYLGQWVLDWMANDPPVEGRRL